MNYSGNYNLNMPEKSEQFNLDHWTQNVESIDRIMKQNEDAIVAGVSNLTQGLSAETLARENGVTDAKNLTNATGILAPAHGGTGQTTLIESLNSLLGTSIDSENWASSDRLIFRRTTDGQVSTMNGTLGKLADIIYQLIAGRISEASIPRGIIYPFAGEFGTQDEPYKFVPLGYLACDGQAISRVTYADLFAIIGTKYGNGDEINTFNVPDLRECALVGAGQNTHDSIATHDTYTLGQFKDDQIQNITGAQANIFNGGDLASNGALYYDAPNNFANLSYQIQNVSYWKTIAGNLMFDASRIARTGTVTHGKQKGVNFIIRA